MARVRVVDLTPGMILDTDVVADDGRFLAPAGTALTSHHLQILRKWGIDEANVRGVTTEDRVLSRVTAEAAAAVDARVAALFQLANDDHPAIKELMELIRSRMLSETSAEARDAS